MSIRPVSSMCSRVELVLFSGLLLCLAGCGGVEPKEGLVRAYGTVTMDGEPLVDVQVNFDHASHPETFGRTDSGGYYDMYYTSSQRGAFSGENVVSFSTADPDRGIKETLPKPFVQRYSQMKIEVTEDGSPYDFHLKSDGTTGSE